MEEIQDTVDFIKRGYPEHQMEMYETYSPIVEEHPDGSHLIPKIERGKLEKLQVGIAYRDAYTNILRWEEILLIKVSKEAGWLAWTEEGATRFYLTEVEKKMKGAEVLELIEIHLREGWYRCFECGAALINKDKIGGAIKGRICPHPRYAFESLLTCHLCWEKHLKKVKQQQKEGVVCWRCHKPLLSCYC